jgi:hypothetical protein
MAGELKQAMNTNILYKAVKHNNCTQGKAAIGGTIRISIGYKYNTEYPIKTALHGLSNYTYQWTAT